MPDPSAAFLAGIDAILPAIRTRAAETERQGRVSPDIMRALTDAHVFRAVQPRQSGGLELPMASFFDGMVRIATACGSTGWVSSVVGIHAWHIALFSDAAQQEVWGDHRDARASSSYAPTGKAEPRPGGFQLSGRWAFSSGVDHCDWALLGAHVPHDAGGEEFRTFLVPRRDFVVDHESWNVTGLAGTGSKDVAVPGAFIPEHRTHRIVDVFHGRDPGFAVNDRPLFHLPWHVVFGYAIASASIGASQGALDAFIETNRARTSALGGPPVAANPAVHRRLAQALTEVDAARTRLIATWRDFQARTAAGEPIPYEARARAKYESAHALAAGPRAVYEVLEVNGGRTMNAASPLQRLFRDIVAMRNHPSSNLELAATLYAQARLGVEPAPFVPSQRYVL